MTKPDTPNRKTFQQFSICNSTPMRGIYYDNRHRKGMEYAFNRAAEGATGRTIWSEMKERGFTNAQGKPFSLAALAVQLKNPVHHDPINPLITEELFNAVQRQIASKRYGGRKRK